MLRDALGEAGTNCRAAVVSYSNALYLLASVLVPVAMLCLLALAVLHLLYLRNPARTDTMRNLSIDHFIVLEQIDRAATLPAADIAFLGDSSCLMGINPTLIERALVVHPVESYCTLGYVGPAGYARMLSTLIARNAAPKVLVLMFQPITFRREANWDYWPAYVANQGKAGIPALKFPRSALDFLEFEWVSRLIYSPLPGAYALFYGGEGAFRSTIRSQHGSAIDPTSGLGVSSIEALQAVPTPPFGEPADFSWNQAYKDSLKVLGASIAKLPPQTRVYLIISPVPDSRPEAGCSGRNEQARLLQNSASIRTGYSKPRKRCSAPFFPVTRISIVWDSRHSPTH